MYPSCPAHICVCTLETLLLSAHCGRAHAGSAQIPSLFSHLIIVCVSEVDLVAENMHACICSHRV